MFISSKAIGLLLVIFFMGIGFFAAGYGVAYQKGVDYANEYVEVNCKWVHNPDVVQFEPFKPFNFNVSSLLNNNKTNVTD